MNFTKLFILFLFVSVPAFAQWNPNGATTGNIYYNGGNVGIGTSNPEAALHINGQLKFPTAGTTAGSSPGLIGYASDFLYDGAYLNTYGFGFHGYDDGNGTHGINAYVSAYYGLDFFTGKESRLRINRNGDVGITRNLGIGVNNPASKLHILNGNRHYHANRYIIGNSPTPPSGGSIKSYILLHRAYDDVNIDDHFVMGKITAVRGGTAAWNRKWTIEVNTASAFNTNRGSIMSYNEPSRLVLLQHNDGSGTDTYVAAEISSAAPMSKFSFTGYANNESLKLVTELEVTNVGDFIGEDPISASYFQVMMPGLGAKSDGATPAKSFVVTSNESGTSLNMGVDATDLKYSWIQSRSRLANAMMPLMLNPWGGSVSIGTNKTNGYKLAVEGTIGAREVNVNLDTWADYVFLPDYKLMPLSEVEQHIKDKGHLPEVPSEKEVLENGVNLGEMNALLLKKVEELTLHLIEQNKLNKEQQSQIDELREKIMAYESRKK